MKDRTRSLRRSRARAPLAAALGLLLWPGHPAAAGESAPMVSAGGAVIRGRVLDGAAMARSALQDTSTQMGGNVLDRLAPVPMASTKLKVHIVEGPARGKVIDAESDAEGSFSLSLDLPAPPPPRSLVASVETPGSPPRYSPAVSPPPAGGEAVFRVYPTTESDRMVASELNVFHSLVPAEGRSGSDLEVHVHLILVNRGAEMLVGRQRPEAPGEPPATGREIFRAPVPAAATVVASSGPGGRKWSEHPGAGSWKWLVVDEPVPPLIEEAQGMAVWEFRYRVPARQSMAIVYSPALDLGQMAAWGAAGDIALESSVLLHSTSQTQADPGEPQGKAREWSVIYSREIPPGSPIPVQIRIDNAVLGEVNRGSLLILMAFFLAAVIAVAAGLLLGRRGPRLEDVLEEASGDEIIARIAEIDTRFEQGGISEKEHRETREKLLAMARYAVRELEPASTPAAAGGEGGASGGPGGLPPRAREILERIRALGDQGPLDPDSIRERAVLSEELARSLLSTKVSAEHGGPPGRGGETR